MFFVRLLRFTLYVTPIFFLFIAGTFLISYSKSSKNQENKYNKEERAILEKEEKIVRKETFENKVKKIEEGVSTYIKEEPYLFNIEKKKYYKVSMITNFYNQRFKDSAFTLNIENTKKLNLVALGLDEKYHMSNYYLEGFAPFITNSIYLPLMTIGTKKAYQLDHLGKLRKKEIWQTSKEAYTLPRGDCEDHAIALADWLISNGEDARVAIGKYENGGHAWVMLFKDKKEYIIEATAKKSFTKAYMIAKFEPKYKPLAMFNREYFWFNSGSQNTTNYSSNKWIKKSHYIKKKI